MKLGAVLSLWLFAAMSLAIQGQIMVETTTNCTVELLSNSSKPYIQTNISSEATSASVLHMVIEVDVQLAQGSMRLDIPAVNLTRGNSTDVVASKVFIRTDAPVSWNASGLTLKEGDKYAEEPKKEGEKADLTNYLRGGSVIAFLTCLCLVIGIIKQKKIINKLNKTLEDSVIAGHLQTCNPRANPDDDYDYIADIVMVNKRGDIAHPPGETTEGYNHESTSGYKTQGNNINQPYGGYNSQRTEMANNASEQQYVDMNGARGYNTRGNHGDGYANNGAEGIYENCGQGDQHEPQYLNLGNEYRPPHLVDDPSPYSHVETPLPELPKRRR